MIIVIIVITVCLLNLHESERCKPAAWMPVGWLPNYIDVRAKGLRPGQGMSTYQLVKCDCFTGAGSSFSMAGRKERAMP